MAGALPHTRAPGQGFYGFDAPPGARPWFRYQHAGENRPAPGPQPGAGESPL